MFNFDIFVILAAILEAILEKGLLSVPPRSVGWNAKGRGTSGVAPKRRRGPDWGIGVWTVAMETDAKAGPFEWVMLAEISGEGERGKQKDEKLGEMKSILFTNIHIHAQL